jgi:hypothetical protein
MKNKYCVIQKYSILNNKKSIRSRNGILEIISKNVKER